MKENILVVVYDGIQNSVFQSQVLAPLRRRLETSNHVFITLLTFENNAYSQEALNDIIGIHDRLHVVCKKRGHAWNWWSLRNNIRDFITLINSLDNVRQVIARGPFAGYVARQALVKNKSKHIRLIIQARGLAAEELLFTNKFKKQKLLRLMYIYILYWWYNRIEQCAYCALHKKEIQSGLLLCIESVSVALKEYLIKQCHADPTQINIATHDIPKSISRTQVLQWRQSVRKTLEIADDTYVYCYMGSARPWQCVDETIEYFVSERKKRRNAFLLILTQDKAVFEKKLAQRFQDGQSVYQVVSVKFHETYQYLAACDAGLLLRSNHVVNWVSRPTKALEYQSVGLPIIHNDTVDWLIQNMP